MTSVWEFLGKSFAFVAAAGVLAAIANQAIVWLRDRGGRKRTARHLALQLSAILDEFVDDTLDFRARLQDDLAQRHDFGNYTFDPPTLADLPLDAEAWQAFDPGLARTSYYFSRQVRWSYRQVVYVSQNLIPPEVAQEYADVAVILARDANNLALLLRLKYRLAPDLEVKAFLEKEDISSVLEEAASSVEQRRQALADTAKDDLASL